MINPRTVVEDRKVYLLIEKGFIITLEIFKTQEEYIIFASSNLPQHDDLVGRARHKNKAKCAALAIKDFSNLIETYHNLI